MMFARVANIVTKRKPSSRFVLIGAGFHDEFQDEMNDYIRKNSLGKGLAVLPWMEYEKMLDYVKAVRRIRVDIRIRKFWLRRRGIDVSWEPVVAH